MDEFSPFVPFYFPGIFSDPANNESYLNSLDSDTRAYVERQMQDGSSMDDVREFINNMKG